MKVMIVDDEGPARDRLRRLLGQVPECRVCAEASNGREALQAVADSEPDVVLLDIRMPGMDGLEAARHLADLEEPPAVIFSTAYGAHALEAFEAHAVDYLLKPIRARRLDDARRKAKRLTRAQAQALNHDEAGPEGRARTHICARVRGNLELVPVDAVRCFEADQKYVTVRYPDGAVLIEDSLRTLEQELGSRFVRIHRRTLVAVDFLEGLEKDDTGKSRVRLAGIQERPEVSRRHLAAVRGLLKRV